MRADHIPCGEYVNESERIAVEHLRAKLRSHDGPHKRWLVLSNVPHAVKDRAIPVDIDVNCIGPSRLGSGEWPALRPGRVGRRLQFWPCVCN